MNTETAIRSKVRAQLLTHPSALPLLDELSDEFLADGSSVEEIADYIIDEAWNRHNDAQQMAHDRMLDSMEREREERYAGI